VLGSAHSLGDLSDADVAMRGSAAMDFDISSDEDGTSDDMDTASAHEVAMHQFRTVGYAVAFLEASPDEVGIPLTRNRIWYVCCNVKRYIGTPDLDANMWRHTMLHCETIRDTIRFLKAKLPPMDLDDFLLPDDHEAVVRSKENLAAKRDAGPPKKKSKATHSAGEGFKWHTEHQTMFSDKGHVWIKPCLDDLVENLCRYPDNLYYWSLSDRARDEILYFDVVKPMCVDGPEQSIDLCLALFIYRISSMCACPVSTHMHVLCDMI
jgi:hypothetical protein